MSVWNRPLFQEALPPGSARAELARMQMQEGGNALIEQLSGRDQGIVLPRERAQAQREQSQALAAQRQQLSDYRNVTGGLRPNAPMVDSQESMEIPREAINEAGFWAPLFWLGTGAGAAITASPYIESLLDKGTTPPFQPTLPPATSEASGTVSPEAIQRREPVAPVTGTIGNPPDVAPAPAPAAAPAPAPEAPAQEAAAEAAPAAAADMQRGPGIGTLASAFSFSPEERADRLRAAYEGREAVYDEILGDPERRRDSAKAQLFFSIAQRALQFASGVSPEGVPMGGSMLSQAAQSFAPVFGDVSQYLATQDQQERELRAARLAAAEQDVTREEEYRAEMLSALMNARGDGEVTAADVFLPAEEVLSSIDIVSPPDLTAAYNFGASLRNTVGRLGQALNVDIAPETREAVRWGEQFNTTVLADLARSIQSSRPSNFTLALVQNLLPAPGGSFESVSSAINAYSGLRDQLNRDLAELTAEYEVNRLLDLPKDTRDTLSLMRRVKETTLQLDEIINSLSGEFSEEQTGALADVTANRQPAPDATENGNQ